jgi:hypothetical protein
MDAKRLETLRLLRVERWEPDAFPQALRNDAKG